MHTHLSLSLSLSLSLPLSLAQPRSMTAVELPQNGRLSSEGLKSQRYLTMFDHSYVYIVKLVHVHVQVYALYAHIINTCTIHVATVVTVVSCHGDLLSSSHEYISGELDGHRSTYSFKCCLSPKRLWSIWEFGRYWPIVNHQ